MSRTTGSADNDALIYRRLKGPQFKSRVTLDRWDGSDWVEIEDVDGDSQINWTDSVQRTKYSNYALQAATNTLSFRVLNEFGKYSPGSGETEAGVLEIDTRIRLNQYYIMERQSLATEDEDQLQTEEGDFIVIQEEFLFYQSVFYLDNVSYVTNGTKIDFVSCRGRDAYKFAIEKDIFLEDLSAGVSIDQLIKDICNDIGISYSGTSIDDLSSFGNRTLADGLDDGEKADDVFEILMAIVNQSDSGGYQMYLQYDDTFNDNIMYVKEIPAIYEADFSFTERSIMGLGSFSKDRDRFLQRMTCLDKKEVPNERENVGSATYTTDGDKTLSVTTSLYRTYTVTVNSGSPVVTLLQVNADSLEFNVTNTGSVTINVFGTTLDTYPNISGEAIDNDNMQANTGQTAQIESLLFESDTEARKTAEGLINKFGTPDNTMDGMEYPYLNTVLENNDMVFPFIRNIFETNLFYIVGISHSWSLNQEATEFKMQDSGLDWLDVYAGFIYDSDFIDWAPEGALQDKPDQDAPLKYDIGLVYDMAYGPNATESSIGTSQYKTNGTFS